MRIKEIIILIIGFILPIVGFSQRVIEDVPENSPKFSVKTGDTFVISLSSNPTTGYSWQIYDFKDSSLVSKKENTYVAKPRQSKNAPVIEGASGHERWVFKANKKGTAVILFKYCRPWETDDRNAIKKKYIVKVK